MAGRPRVYEAKTEEERTRAYRLRYRVFIEELNWTVHGADASTGLREPADDGARILIAEVDGVPVATAAVDQWGVVDIDRETTEHYHLDRFEADWRREDCALIRKFTVIRSHRGTTAALEILASLYRMVHRIGARFCFLDSSPYLIDYYERVGCRRYAPHFFHDENHIIAVPMVIALHDMEHLKRTESPLLPIAMFLQVAHDPEERRWLDTHYGSAVLKFDEPDPTMTAMMPIEPLSRADLADTVLLDGLSEADTEVLLDEAETFDVEQREHVVEAHGRGFDLYVLLSGYADVTADLGGRHVAVATLGPGDIFGEVNFLTRTDRSATVTALTPCEVLRLPLESVERLHRERPDVAMQVYRNIACTLAWRLRLTNRWVAQVPL